MEVPERDEGYKIRGGKTIIGKIFGYQEKTGMSVKEILKLPYIQFIIGMLDAPTIDFANKKETEKVNKPKTVEDELAAFARF